MLFCQLERIIICGDGTFDICVLQGNVYSPEVFREPVVFTSRICVVLHQSDSAIFRGITVYPVAF